MFGYGTLSVQAAVNRCRKLSRGGSVLLVGDFTGRHQLPGENVQHLTFHEAMTADHWHTDLEDPTLVLHDDVLLSRSALARLVRAHQQTAMPTVPWTNDNGTDHEIGPLRTSPGSERELDTIRTPKEQTSITTASTVFVASRTQVQEILRMGVTDTRTRINHPEFMVARTVAAHVGTCLEHRTKPVDPSRPLLVASMIVRDEGEVIERCLSSLSGIVDRIEVVDTGSTDDTVNKSLEHGAVVTHFPWEDNFAKARNIALDRCRDARFVLIVDADEVVRCGDPTQLREFLEGSGGEHDAFKVRVENIDADEQASDFVSVRIVPYGKARWQGRVHELLIAGDPATPVDGPLLDLIRIDHFGYTAEVFADKNKQQRNLDLAEAAYREHPGFKTRLDLARSLPSTDDRAIELFQEAACDRAGSSQALSYAEAALAVLYLKRNKVDAALTHATRSIEHCNGEYTAHLARSTCWERSGDDVSIAESHKSRSTSHLATPMFDVQDFRLRTDSISVGALARLGLVEEAVDLAVDVLSLDPEALDHWGDLASSLPTEARTDALAALIRLDPNARFLAQTLTVITSAELAKLARIHTEGGHRSAELVVTGIMAAILTEEISDAEHLAQVAATCLTVEQMEATAERAQLRGATSVARLLNTHSLA